MLNAKRSFTVSIALIAALLATATALPVASASVATVASASAATRTTISEAVSPSVITYGAVQSITGRLIVSGSRAGLAATRVVIQRQLNGTRTWSSWMATKTNATGVYKVSWHPGRNYNYRAHFAGTSRYGPATSTIRLGTVKPQLTATLAPSSRTMTVGQVATYTGTVRPRLATQRVLVQEAVAGKWLDLASTGPSALGKYSVAWRPTKAGSHIYRLKVTPGTLALAPGYSANTRVTAFRWLWLSDLALADSLDSAYINRGSMSVNGITYPHSIWVRVDNKYNMWGEWGLARQCTTFDATVGIGDTSASGTSGGLDAWSDDTPLSDRVQQFGTSARVTTPLYSGLRLRLQGIYTGSAGITRVTWGNARIRCSF